MTEKNGYVYLIGAGPGDPGLLTVKAEKVLHEVDVILYDNLVSHELIEQFDAIKIYTGKRKDRHHFEQGAINREIVRQAEMGRNVARLKGGDPYVFGRGGEEISYLRKYGIRYEIIPGITAVQGAGAYTEIPLTLRKISSSLAICTGHPLDKIHVPDADTIVYYMVASSASEVAKAIIAKGKEEGTKVAIVQNATRYNQKVSAGTLGELKSRDKMVISPALLILGENVTEFVEDYWFQRKKKVLVVGEGAGFYDGKDCIIMRYLCKESKEEHRYTTIREIAEPGAAMMLLFPDRYSVFHFFSFLTEHGIDIRKLRNTAFCPAGAEAVSELVKRGVIPDLCLESAHSCDISKEMESLGISGENIIIPSLERMDEKLVYDLGLPGNTVAVLDVAPHDASFQAEVIDLDYIDELYFSSPYCVKAFRERYTNIPDSVNVRTAGPDVEKEYLDSYRKRADL